MAVRRDVAPLWIGSVRWLSSNSSGCHRDGSDRFTADVVFSNDYRSRARTSDVPPSRRRPVPPDTQSILSARPGRPQPPGHVIGLPSLRPNPTCFEARSRRAATGSVAVRNLPTRPIALECPVVWTSPHWQASRSAFGTAEPTWQSIASSSARQQNVSILRPTPGGVTQRSR